MEVSQRTDATVHALDPDFAMRWLAATVAHELGGPMTAINVSVEQMMKRECSSCSTASADLKVVLSQINRISDLSRRLIDLARPGEPTFARVDANDVAADVVEWVERPLSRTKVQIKLIRSPEDVMVRADARQLQQVLLNLVLNAQKALAAEGGTIEVETRRVQNMVELMVRDDGPGIEQQDMQKIFLPFWSKSGGTGMGLSMARSIIHAHDGMIEVNSAKGNGAVFTVRLPVGEA